MDIITTLPLQAHRDAEVAVAVTVAVRRRGRRTRTRSGRRAMVVPMVARTGLGVMLVMFMVLVRRNRFAVVPLVRSRVPVRPLVRSCLRYRRQQSYYG